MSSNQHHLICLFPRAEEELTTSQSLLTVLRLPAQNPRLTQVMLSKTSDTHRALVLRFYEEQQAHFNDFSSTFAKTGIARLHTRDLSHCEIVAELIRGEGDPCLHMRSEETLTELQAIDLLNVDIDTVSDAVIPTNFEYNAPPPTYATKPSIPQVSEMLNNDHVAWLQDHYCRQLGLQKRWLDKAGHIAVFDRPGKNNIPVWFPPAYGNSMEIDHTSDLHRTDILFGTLFESLFNNKELDKLPNELIISQLVCEGDNYRRGIMSGSHWIARNYHYQGLNADALEKITTAASAILAEKPPGSCLYAIEINNLMKRDLFRALYDKVDIVYMNSSKHDKTSHAYKNSDKKLIVGSKIETRNERVPSQWVIGSPQSRHIICGDLAVQNGVHHALFAKPPQFYNLRAQTIAMFSDELDVKFADKKQEVKNYEDPEVEIALKQAVQHSYNIPGNILKTIKELRRRYVVHIVAKFNETKPRGLLSVLSRNKQNNKLITELHNLCQKPAFINGVRRGKYQTLYTKLDMQSFAALKEDPRFSELWEYIVKNETVIDILIDRLFPQEPKASAKPI